jgi:dTDP-6-deoxy-L-talose 4-dehydrogenase (NAD+)
MTILVTGANGYLGQGIVKQLCDDGISVNAADYSLSQIDYRAKKFECDLFSISDPYEYFERPDAVLHLAWKNGFVHSALSHIEELPNHYMFLKRLADSGIKQIAVMGSMHEVGFFEGSIREDTPTNPMSLYGIGKNALRQATRVLCEQMDHKPVYQWLRGYYIVGNSQYGSSIFSKITAAEKKKEVEFPFTSGLNQWDFVDYDVFCRQTAATVEQTEIAGIVNICSGRPEKLSDRVERFIKENGYNIRLAYGKFPDRPYDSKAVWGDNSKILKIMEGYHK